MTKEELLQAIGNIDDDLILRAREEQKKKPKIWIVLGAAAACLAIAVAATPFLQAKKSADMDSVENLTYSSTATAEEWTGGAEQESTTEDVADAGNGIPIDEAPEASAGKLADSDFAYQSFILAETEYRIVTPQELVDSVLPPSEELAGEYLGTVLLEDVACEVYRVSDSENGDTDSDEKAWKEQPVLVNIGEQWYYALLAETP